MFGSLGVYPDQSSDGVVVPHEGGIATLEGVEGKDWDWVFAVWNWGDEPDSGDGFRSHDAGSAKGFFNVALFEGGP